ncbi:MAG TPA: lysylphosphatidylglycerol synthase transmembrane domain-containing protein [Fibrobacteria bacterium]|nr:lysylphosphatidylglycerol synthase transmembrane domain-containing protein [Fibrobacteria bacterium]
MTTPQPPGRPAGDVTRPAFRHLWFWVRLVVVIAILWWVVESNGRERIAQTLLSARLPWVGAAMFVFFLSIVAGAWQWHLLLKIQGVSFSMRDCFRSYYSGMFLNNFLPGTVGGDALRVWDVHRQQLAQQQSSLGKAAASTLLDRLMGFSALSFFSLLALAIEFHRQDLPRGLLLNLLQAVGAVTVAFSLLLLLLLSRRFAGALHALIRALGMERLGQVHTKVQDSLQAYKARWNAIGKVFLVACVVQLLRISVHAFCAWALGLSLAPAFFFSFIPLIALTAVLPLNVGGWGVPQGLGAYLYGLPGVLTAAAAGVAATGASVFDPKAAAAALAFLPTVIGMVVMLGGGFYFVFRPSREPRIPS